VPKGLHQQVLKVLKDQQEDKGLKVPKDHKVPKEELEIQVLKEP
jgi:hypothetical protein